MFREKHRYIPPDTSISSILFFSVAIVHRCSQIQRWIVIRIALFIEDELPRVVNVISVRRAKLGLAMGMSSIAFPAAEKALLFRRRVLFPHQLSTIFQSENLIETFNLLRFP